MNARFVRGSCALGAVLFGACAVGLSPMIDYATLRAQRGGRFFVAGDTVLILASNPQGANLALELEPRLDRGRVVLAAGVTSSGAPGVKTYCRDVRSVSPPPDWADRVFWRNTTGELVQVESIARGEAARQLIAKSCGSGQPPK